MLFCPTGEDGGNALDAQLGSLMMRSKMGPEWPDEALITELKVLAEGLFIWIATICSWLHSAYEPRSKLINLLSKSQPGWFGLTTATAGGLPRISSER